jgi:hypothetical protein
MQVVADVSVFSASPQWVHGKAYFSIYYLLIYLETSYAYVEPDFNVFSEITQWIHGRASFIV